MSAVVLAGIVNFILSTSPALRNTLVVDTTQVRGTFDGAAVPDPPQATAAVSNGHTNKCRLALGIAVNQRVTNCRNDNAAYGQVFLLLLSPSR